MLAMIFSPSSRAPQAVGDLRRAPDVGTIPLRFDDHRRRAIERAAARTRATSAITAAATTARPADQSGGDPRADRLDRDERHHVADAERMAVHERRPGQRRGRHQRERDERIGAPRVRRGR